MNIFTNQGRSLVKLNKTNLPYSNFSNYISLYRCKQIPLLDIYTQFQCTDEIFLEHLKNCKLCIPLRYLKPISKSC